VLVHYVTCLCEESLFVYIRVNKIYVKIVDALVLLLQQRVDMLEWPWYCVFLCLGYVCII
jgi:hypothetical protein